MKMRTGNDRVSRGIYWFAILLAVVSVVAKGHSRMLDAVLGMAGALFVVSVARLAHCKLRVRG